MAAQQAVAVKAIAIDDQNREVEVYWNGKVYGKTAYLTVSHKNSFAKSGHGEQITVTDKGETLSFKSNFSAEMDERCYEAVKAVRAIF